MDNLETHLIPIRPFTERELFEFEISASVERILHFKNTAYNPKRCGSSVLDEIVECGMNGELGEKFRLLKKLPNSEIISEFADVILK